MKPNWNRNAVTVTTCCKPAKCRILGCLFVLEQWMILARERYTDTFIQGPTLITLGLKLKMMSFFCFADSGELPDR